ITRSGRPSGSGSTRPFAPPSGMSSRRQTGLSKITSMAARAGSARRIELLVERRERARVHVALEHAHHGMGFGRPLRRRPDRGGKELILRNRAVDDLALERALG